LYVSGGCKKLNNPKQKEHELESSKPM